MSGPGLLATGNNTSDDDVSTGGREQRLSRSGTARNRCISSSDQVAEMQTVTWDNEIPAAKRARRVRLSIAANVRVLRQERGYSQEDLAAACDMTRSAISRLERGEHEPRVSTLLTLSAALGVDPAALLNGLR
jgi:DNA-binding XRE family transcriptional regulator